MHRKIVRERGLEAMHVGMTLLLRGLIEPFDAHCCHMGTTIKHPVPDSHHL